MNKLLLLLPLLAFFSCTSDNNSKDNPDNSKLKLKSITYTESIGDEFNNEVEYKTTLEYFYGSNGYVNKIKTYEEYDQSVTYDYYDYEQNQVTQWKYELEGRNVTSNYFYQNDLLIKSINTEEEGPHIKEFEYDSVKNLVKEVYTIATQANDSSTTTFTYDALGNIVNEVYAYNDHDATVTAYGYDNHHHPFTHVFPKNYLKTRFIGPNNRTKETNLKTGETSVTKYEYNAQGYPIKEVQNGKIIIYTYI